MAFVPRTYNYPTVSAAPRFTPSLPPTITSPYVPPISSTYSGTVAPYTGGTYTLPTAPTIPSYPVATPATYPVAPSFPTTTPTYPVATGALTTYTGAVGAYTGNATYGSASSYQVITIGDTFAEDPSLTVVGERYLQLRVPVFERHQSLAALPPPQVVERQVPIPVPQVQYVDKPVYIDRPVEKIVYVDKPVEKIVYVERQVAAPEIQVKPAAAVAVRQTWNVTDADLARKMDAEDGVIDGKRGGVAINCAAYEVKGERTWEVSDARMAKLLDGSDGVSDGRTGDGSTIKISRDGRVDGIA
eukprot:NODE_5304_length_1033_cov_60.362637_g4738_i0.p1 GENE.NODE_5304_length_1033_cov_60.362637_g4738_i0~~NODE_5304_length_1033_cov_60.362637_g4738_i0.p1  ORF type:complete len:301 (+),score=84.44 NODE_5304_length_1033_cov_60.362637_g4738_i0:62-964(+)